MNTEQLNQDAFKTTDIAGDKRDEDSRIIDNLTFFSAGQIKETGVCVSLDTCMIDVVQSIIDSAEIVGMNKRILNDEFYSIYKSLPENSRLLTIFDDHIENMSAVAAEHEVSSA